jgi:Arm DNA-binding domain
VKNAKLESGKRRDKLYDGGGLYFELNANGSRYWRLSYRFGGKQRTLALGLYPAVSLARAREKRDEVKVQIANGADPKGERKRERAAGKTFADIAHEWLQRKMVAEGKDAATLKRPRSLLQHIGHRYDRDGEIVGTSAFGKRLIAEIEAPDLLDVLREIEDDGHLGTASPSKPDKGPRPSEGAGLTEAVTRRLARLPCCYEKNLADARGMASYYRAMVKHPERRHQGTGSDEFSLRRKLKEEDRYRQRLLRELTRVQEEYKPRGSPD